MVFLMTIKEKGHVTPHVSFDKNDSVTPYVLMENIDSVTPYVFFHDDQ